MRSSRAERRARFFVVADGTGRRSRPTAARLVRAPVDRRQLIQTTSSRTSSRSSHDQHDRRGVRQVSTISTPEERLRPTAGTGAGCDQLGHLTIDGQSVTVPKAPTSRGRAHARHRHQRVLLPPRPADRCAVPPVPGRGREEPKLQPSCQQVCATTWSSTRPTSSRRSRASSSSSSRSSTTRSTADLRQGRRVHAAEAVLRARQRGLAGRHAKVHKNKVVDLGPTIVLDQSAASCARAASGPATSSPASTSSTSRTAVITRS